MQASDRVGVSAPWGRTINPVEKMVLNDFAAARRCFPPHFPIYLSPIEAWHMHPRSPVTLQRQSASSHRHSRGGVRRLSGYGIKMPKLFPKNPKFKRTRKLKGGLPPPSLLVVVSKSGLPPTQLFCKGA